MHPIVTTVTLAAASANGIAQSQSLGAAGALTLNGSLVTAGTANLGSPRRVIITSTGNDSGITWTITGTSRSQQNSTVISETIQGANAGVAQSTQDFATVTSIVGSGATAGTVTAGTNTVASGPWVPWSQYADDFQVSVYGRIQSGAPTWGAEYTYDDVFNSANLPTGQAFPAAITLTGLTAQTGNGDAQITFPVRASRLTLTAGTGSVSLTQTQQGH
jgi:hypothetical protein